METCKTVTKRIACLPCSCTHRICQYRRLVAWFLLTIISMTLTLVSLLHFGPINFQKFVQQEFNSTRNNSLQTSMAESWQRTGPAMHATSEAVSAWGRASYPLALKMTTLWYDVLITIGPPFLIAVSNLNPLVYWVLVGLACVSMLLYLLRRECQRRKVYQQVSMAYERRTNAVRRGWKRIADGVREKSVFAASILPHLVFVLLFTASLWLAPDYVRAMLADGQTIALFALPLPLLLSVRAVLSPDTNEDGGTKTTAAATPSTRLGTTSSPSSASNGSTDSRSSTTTSTTTTTAAAAAATPTSAISSLLAPLTSLSPFSSPFGSSSSNSTITTTTPITTTTRSRSTQQPFSDVRRARKAWLSYWAMIAMASLLWQFPVLGKTFVSPTLFDRQYMSF